MTADRRAAAAVAFLFFVKAACLALLVTPLWDVPDEIGHFSYAADLADGRGAPLPGRGVIAPEIAARWPGHAGAPVLNWTAIHPPGYAIFAAAALRVARAFTTDLERQVRWTRLVSALFGGAAIYLLYELLVAAAAERSAALAFEAAAGCIPMFTHMASGVSHDTLSAALGVVCAIAWVRLGRRPSAATAAALAISLAAAGAVKATIAPVAIVLVLLLPARLPGRLFSRIAAAAAVGGIALSTTALWWIRRLGGIPTPPAARVRHGARAFFAAFRDLPIADHTLKNFFGLIGWTAHGDLRWFQISGPFLAVDLGAAVAVGLLAAAWTWRRDFRDRAAPHLAAVASWLVAAAVLVATFGWLVSRPAVSPLKLAAESFLFALPFLALFRIATKGEEGIVDSARLVSLGFALAYFWNVARSFLLTGEMRGAHGRYYFAVIGFLALGFWLPAADLLRARSGRNRAFAAAVIILFANEAAFYAFRAVPFYRGAAAAVLRP